MVNHTGLDTFRSNAVPAGEQPAQPAPAGPHHHGVVGGEQRPAGHGQPPQQGLAHLDVLVEEEAGAGAAGPDRPARPAVQVAAHGDLQAARGRVGRIFTAHDRAGEATLSSRLGLQHVAIEVDDGFDFWRYTVDELTHGARIDYLICDEAQFYTPRQVEQLAKIVDELQLDVYAFGILSDFRTELFPGSRRLVELADRMQVLQVEALCWCGKRATHNARTENGEMVTEGDVIVVGDVDETGEQPAEVAYEVLCRQHHRRRMTAARARAVSMVSEPLPFSG